MEAKLSSYEKLKISALVFLTNVFLIIILGQFASSLFETPQDSGYLGGLGELFGIVLFGLCSPFILLIILLVVYLRKSTIKTQFYLSVQLILFLILSVFPFIFLVLYFK